MARPVGFQLTSDNPERSIAFYSEVFGWKFHKTPDQPDYWHITTGDDLPGIDGGLVRKVAPGQSTVNAILVPSIDDFVRRIEAKGGKTVGPKTEIAGVGHFAVCADPNNNTFGVLQRSEQRAEELSGEELEAVQGGGSAALHYSKW
jgi:predicted enzyme related to lactoylglutathione lyase